MKLMFEYSGKMASRYIMLKIQILASVRKWRHQLNTVSVYQLILIFFNNKKYCVA